MFCVNQLEIHKLQVIVYIHLVQYQLYLCIIVNNWLKYINIRENKPGATSDGRAAKGNPGSLAFSLVDNGCFPKLPGTSYWPGPGESCALSVGSRALGKLYFGLSTPCKNFSAILYCPGPK